MPDTGCPIAYIEIPAPDVARASAFYAEVFGWEVTDSDLTDRPYAMFRAGSNGLAGGLHGDLPVSQEGILVYLSVENIPSTLSAVVGAGGTVVREKMAIGGGYGFSAEFTDPAGNRLGLIAPA